MLNHDNEEHSEVQKDPQQEEMVAYTAKRANRIFANNPVPSNKRVFIDLTQNEILKPQKKNFDGVKKVEPFEKLGQGVIVKVQSDMDEYAKNIKTVFPKCSKQEYHENVKELICRYLLFGLEEFLIHKIKHPFNQKSSSQRLQEIALLSKNIQTTIYYNHKNNFKAYQNRCKMIIDNFKDYQNRQLRQKVLCGNITLQQLSSVHQSELDSTQRRLENQKKLQQILAKVDVTQQNQSQEINLQRPLESKQSNSSRSQQALQYEQMKPILVDQIQRIIPKILNGFYDKIRQDLPPELIDHFQNQLKSLQFQL